MVKICFFDIDGTLVSLRTHQMSASCREALSRLRQAGVKVIVSTGRPLYVVDNMPGVTFDGYICTNGALSYVSRTQTGCQGTPPSPDDLRVVERNPIPPADVATMLKLSQGQGDLPPFPVAFARANEMVCPHHTNVSLRVFQELDFRNMPREVTPDDILSGGDVYQMVSFFTAAQDHLIMGHLPGCVARRWHPDFADVVQSGLSKANGVAAVLRHYGLTPQQAASFGDGGNDIPMFHATALSFALGNAEQEVKAQATYTAPDCDKDGIAWAVDKLLGQVQGSWV